MTDLCHSKVKLNPSIKTQSQPELNGKHSVNSLEKWFSVLFSYPWSHWKGALLGDGWMHSSRSGTAVSVLLVLSLWFKEGEISFYPFRKMKWTNAKITGNSCYHNISSLCLGSVLQQRVRVLQSLSNLDFSPWKFKYKAQGGISWQSATSLPLYGVKSSSWHLTRCAPAAGNGSNAASFAPCPNKIFNWFCLQFSSFLLPCGNIAYFV